MYGGFTMETTHLFAIVALVGENTINYFTPELILGVISPLIPNLFECYQVYTALRRRSPPNNRLLNTPNRRNTQKSTVLNSKIRFILKNRFLGIVLRVDRSKSKQHIKVSPNNENNTNMESRQEKNPPADAEEH